MRYTVLFCSKRGVKRVNRGQARSGLHARKPTPRRSSVFCSTTLDIRISNAHGESVFAEIAHFAKKPDPASGRSAVLGRNALGKPGDCATARRSSCKAKPSLGSIALRDEAWRARQRAPELYERRRCRERLSGVGSPSRTSSPRPRSTETGEHGPGTLRYRASATIRI